MKRFQHLILTLLLFISAPSWAYTGVSLKQNDSMPGYVPKDDFVPDSKTAIAIAIAILIPIYGEDKFNGKGPYLAALNHGKRFITGSLAKNVVGGRAGSSAFKVIREDFEGK